MTQPFSLSVGAQAAETVARNDGWMNVFTGMGVAGKDKGSATGFGGALALSVGMLEQVYSGDAIAAKIVDLPAAEMVREWIDFNHGEDPEEAKAILSALDEMKARPHIKEALKWARLFGGAMVVLAVDDGRPAKEPVNLEAIRKVEIINVMDRWQVFPETYYGDATSSKFGQVETYRLVPITMSAQIETIVHETRMLRFDGVPLPPRQRLRNWGWGDSVLNRVYEVIRDYQGSHGTLPTIIQEFIQSIYKLKNLAQLLTQGGPDATQKVINRLQTMQLGRSLFRAALLDENEDMQRTSLTVTGLGDLLDKIEKRLVASTDMPHTILLGEAPGASLGEGGQAQKRDWYDSIAARQEDELRGPLSYLLELVLRSKQGPTGGQLPESWSFTFKPLWQLSAKEEADTRFVQAQTDAIYLDRGVLSEGEVARSRFGGDGYSTDTVLDMDARNELGELDENNPPAEEDGGDPPQPAPDDEEPEDDTEE